MRFTDTEDYRNFLRDNGITDHDVVHIYYHWSSGYVVVNWMNGIEDTNNYFDVSTNCGICGSEMVISSASQDDMPDCNNCSI